MLLLYSRNFGNHTIRLGGNRQRNDIGSQSRSAVYYRTEEQRDAVYTTMDVYQSRLAKARFGGITTEVKPLGRYVTAERYHQNYLNENPNGCCALGGISVKFLKEYRLRGYR